MSQGGYSDIKFRDKGLDASAQSSSCLGNEIGNRECLLRGYSDFATDMCCIGCSVCYSNMAQTEQA